MNREKLGEKSIETLFLLCALVGVVSVTAIIVFVFYKGLHPFFGPDAYSFLDFITGTRWAPGENVYGIFYMIVASVLATVGAIIIGVPVGLLTAVFISELAPDRFVRIIKPAVELLAGIPSVLYGAFGLGVIVPLIKKVSPMVQGQSLLAVIIVLTIMILPTIVSLSETSLRAVPKSYREASLWAWRFRNPDNLPCDDPGSQIRYPLRSSAGHWPGHRRNHGGDDDRGKSHLRPS